MDSKKIGKAIQYLRKRAGYTQKELAERLVISDKAVSRWERGIGIPDISLLRSLSIILDTDIDSLLEGSVATHEVTWKGLLAIDYSPSAFIYDKPISDYLLSYFILMSIRDIIIFAKSEDAEYLKGKYGNGHYMGINISFCIIQEGQILSESIWANNELFAQSNVAVLLASCVIYGVGLTRFLQRGLLSSHDITALAIVRNDVNQDIKIDGEKRVCNIKSESVPTRYHYCLLPLLFLRGGIKKIRKYSFNGFDELSKQLINESVLYVELLDKGFIGVRINNLEAAFEAGVLIALIQKNTGTRVCCLEEIAYRRGMISQDELLTIASQRGDLYLIDI